MVRNDGAGMGCGTMVLDEGAVRNGSAARASEHVYAHEVLRVSTGAPTMYVDLTERLCGVAGRAGVDLGLLHVQTRHTTTGILINEGEPLLLSDIGERLEEWAPAGAGYRHDDFSRRVVNLVPGERRNGHSHCRAMLLRTSETVHLVGGRLALGRWQRILFVELDGPQEREISVVIQGVRTPSLNSFASAPHPTRTSA